VTPATCYLLPTTLSGRLASGSGEKTVRVWDGRSWSTATYFRLNNGPVAIRTEAGEVNAPLLGQVGLASTCNRGEPCCPLLPEWRRPSCWRLQHACSSVELDPRILILASPHIARGPKKLWPSVG
jgi:hypothetical protein